MGLPLHGFQEARKEIGRPARQARSHASAPVAGARNKAAAAAVCFVSARFGNYDAAVVLYPYRSYGQTDVTLLPRSRRTAHGATTSREFCETPSANGSFAGVFHGGVQSKRASNPGHNTGITAY